MSMMLGTTIGFLLIGLALGVWEFMRQHNPPPSERLEIERDERQKKFYAKVLSAIGKRSLTSSGRAIETRKKPPQ